MILFLRDNITCPLNVSYSALFADDLKSIFRKPGHIKGLINKNLDSLTNWLSQWHLKMNANSAVIQFFQTGGKTAWILI